jgi:peptide/nickel transport system substrate-binding protein
MSSISALHLIWRLRLGIGYAATAGKKELSMRINLTSGRCGRVRGLAVTGAAVALLLPACSTAANDKAAAQSFTLSLPVAPTSLDLAKDTTSGATILGLTNNLLEDLGANGTLTPALATSVTTPNDTTLVYHLRKNVRFSDGTALTPQDVAWSLKHNFAPSAPVAVVMNDFEDATVTGADEVTVHLTHYDSTARQMIGMFGVIYHATQAQVHPKDFGTPSAIPIGTGPYRVTSFTTSGITVQKNPRYWGTAPPFKQIKFVYIAQDNTAQLAMRSGSVQAALVQNPNTIASWKAISGARLYPLQPAGLYSISMDVTSPPFNDVHLRKAVAYAIDSAGLAQAVYHGEAQTAHSVVGADMISAVAPSVASTNDFLNHLPQYGFDLGKAKAELAQSAHPNGLTINLPYPSSDGRTAIVVQSMQHTLGLIGITVRLAPMDANAYWTKIATHKDLGMQILGFAGVGNDPSKTLGVLVGKANAGTNGLNWANYYPPLMERAWETMTQSHDKSARWRATQDILTSITTDIPYIPLFTAPLLIVLNGGFHLPDSGIYETALQNTGQWVYAVH